MTLLKGSNYIKSKISNLIYYLNEKIMKLKKFLIRYYPPGILLEYVRSNG